MECTTMDIVIRDIRREYIIVICAMSCDRYV